MMIPLTSTLERPRTAAHSVRASWCPLNRSSSGFEVNGNVLCPTHRVLPCVLSLRVPTGSIHGDADVGNLLRSRDGGAILGDLDEFSITLKYF